MGCSRFRTLLDVKPIVLGQSTLSISPIIFGSARYQSGRTADRIRVVHAAIDAGMTSLDTAPLYEFGAIESMLGGALRDRRNEVQILSKVGLRWDDDHGDLLFQANDPSGVTRKVRRDSRPASIRKDVEESLARLGTDRIDLCQIHQPDRHVPIEDSLGELSRMIDEGKVREIGISNFSAGEFFEAAAILSPKTGAPRVASNQLHYSLLERSAEKEIFPFAKEKGIGVLAYSPLEAGVLTGKLLDRNRPPDAPSDFRFQTPVFRPANAHRINAALREVVEPIAQNHGANLTQVCLAWLLAQNELTAVIAGASNERHAQTNVGATEIDLSAEERQAIDVRFAEIRIDPNAGISRIRRAKILARRVRGKIDRVLGRS